MIQKIYFIVKNKKALLSIVFTLSFCLLRGVAESVPATNVASILATVKSERAGNGEIDQKILREKFSVDFHTSMGKYDNYLKFFYAKSLSNTPDWWRKGIPNATPQELYNFFFQVYEQNKLSSIAPDGRQRIPKVFHQIWVGKKPFPEKYKRWQATWKNVPGWEYKLWTDKEVASFPLINRELYENEKSMGARADLLRIEVLYREGGVYIDTDFECIKPEMFNLLNSTYDFYAGITPFDAEVIVLNNALIGSVAGHPILKNYINDVARLKKGLGLMDVVARGPGLLTNMSFLYGCKGTRDIFLPTSFFYSLVLYFPKKNEQYRTLTANPEGFEKIKSQEVKPESIAIHYWESSWTAPDAYIP